MLKSSLILSTISLISVSTMAQEKQTPLLNSNRIGITQSSRTVVKGGFQLESGLLISNYKRKAPNNSYYFKNYSGPRTSISYGLTDFMELQMGGNLAYGSHSTDSGLIDKRINFSLHLGVKFNLSEQRRMLPQSALSISYRRYNDYFGEPMDLIYSNWSWRYRLGKHFNLAGNIILGLHPAQQVRAERGIQVGLTMKLGYDFNENFGLFTEWGFMDEFEKTGGYNLGAWYKISPKFLVSLNVGTSSRVQYWQNGNQHFMANMGVSYLLHNPNKSFKRKVKKLR